MKIFRISPSSGSVFFQWFFLQVFEDVALKREILDLAVKCKNHKRSCEWTGELRDSKVTFFLLSTSFFVQCHHAGNWRVFIVLSLKSNFTTPAWGKWWKLATKKSVKKSYFFKSQVFLRSSVSFIVSTKIHKI